MDVQSGITNNPIKVDPYLWSLPTNASFSKDLLWWWKEGMFNVPTFQDFQSGDVQSSQPQQDIRMSNIIPQEQIDQKLQSMPQTERFYDKEARITREIESKLDRDYWVDPDRIEEIAERASNELWISPSFPAHVRAWFFIEQNKDNDEVMSEYKMWRFKRWWQDFLQRVENVWSAWRDLRKALQDAKDVEWWAFWTEWVVADLLPRKRLRQVWALANFVWDVFGETFVWALELADNLVLRGAADRAIYDILETDQAKDIFQWIANSKTVQEMAQWASQNPELAKDLTDVLDIGLLGLDVLWAWALTKWWKQAASWATRAAWRTIQRWAQALESAIPSVWRAISGVWSAVKPVADVIKEIPTSFVSKISGLSADTRTAVIDPKVAKYFDQLKNKSSDKIELFKREVVDKFQEKKNELASIWDWYSSIRNIKEKIDLSPMKKRIEDLLEKQDIKVLKWWKLDFSDSKISAKENIKAVQSAFDSLYNRKEATPRVALNKRNALDDLIGFDWWAKKEWEKLILSLRKEYDNLLKEKIPQLKQVDKKYGDLVQEIRAAEKDFYNKDWSLKDSAISKFTNIYKENNAERLKRLEKINPEVKDISRAILAYQDLEKASSSAAWLYAPWIVAAAWFGWLFWEQNSAVPLVILALTNPRVIVEAIQRMSKIKGKIKGISWSKEQFANKKINEIAEWRFKVKEAEELKTVVEQNPEVEQVFKTSIVPVSEWPMQRWATLPEWAIQRELDQPVRDIVEINNKDFVDFAPWKQDLIRKIDEVPDEIKYSPENVWFFEDVSLELENALKKQRESTTKWMKKISEISAFSKIKDRLDNQLEVIKEKAEREFYESIMNDIKKDPDIKLYNDLKQKVQNVEAKEQLIRKVWNKKTKSTDTIKKRELSFSQQKEKVIEQIKEEMNVDQFEATDIYDQMANEAVTKSVKSNVKQAEKTLKDIEKLSSNLKPSGKLSQNTDEVLAKNTKSDIVDSDLSTSSLMEEAKKYDSAEEFAERMKNSEKNTTRSK